MKPSSLAPSRLFRWFAAFAALLGALPLHAQLMEITDPKAKPVIVESASITTEVTGRLAVTTFDLVFRNPNPRILEGTFQFPLLDGQNVVRFALDMNGALREAVPVEKVKGRIVFEEIERRRVDPGLIEKTEGNNYRARIFPIPANGTRRIVIAYQEDLARSSGKPAYRLALDFPEPLKQFRLAVTAFSDGTQPPEARTTLKLDLPAWRNARLLEVERTDFEARGVLELTLPAVEHPRIVTGKLDGREYFYAEVPAPAATAKARPSPHIVGLLWDASGSGRQRDHDKEFALLDAWFATVKNVEVRLVRLRDQAEAPQTFTVRGGDWSALKAELTRTVYDGATALDGLVNDTKVEEWLLFSDGLFNYGTVPASARLPLSGAVHAILSAPRADAACLRGLAGRQGGEFVNLLETPASDAARRLRTQSLRVLSIDRDPEAVAQVFPEAGTPVTEDTLVVTGLLRTASAKVRVRIGHSAADAREVEVALTSGENPSRLAPRAWAAAKINLLSLNPDANREDIRRTSRDFGIVTADTSLIVLETVEDYARYDIAPPAELRAEWDRLQGRTLADQRKTTDTHLASVFAAFQERIKWWEKKFPKDKPKADEGEKLKGMPAPAAAGAGSDETIILGQFSVRSEHEGRARNMEARRSVAPAPAAARAAGLTPGFEMVAGEADANLSDGSGGMMTPSAGSTPSASISLQRWSPDAGYLARLRRAAPEDAYAVYLEERADHVSQPGFFLDVSNHFFDIKKPDLALRILSNLAELQLEDVALLRVLAHRLTQAGRAELARPLFERVVIIRPDEPQSHRDLALVCAELKNYQRAVDLLWGIVSKPWDGRFPEVEQIALAELNAIVATCGQALDLSKVDQRFLKNLPVTTRVILTWDANDCDIDLWVTDPNGEQAMYNHPLTHQGGHMSRDFTGGYGPEEFILRSPKAGKYLVQINYYGDRRQNALGPVTAQVRLITNFGTREQKEERITVRLSAKQEVLDIGSFEIGGGK